METAAPEDQKTPFFTNTRLLIAFVLVWLLGIALGGIAKHYTIKPNAAIHKITLDDFRNNYTQPGKVSLLVDVNNDFVEGYTRKTITVAAIDTAAPDFYFKIDSLGQVLNYVKDSANKFDSGKIPMLFAMRTNGAMKLLSGSFIVIFLLCTYIMGVLIVRIVKKFFFQKK